jgi:hydrogenase expression/formation protein HypC
MEASMCLAVPARVVEIEGQDAKVDILGNVRDAKLSLIDEVSIGDYVLIHAGFAIQKLEAEDAEETLNLFKLMGEKLNEEADL